MDRPDQGRTRSHLCPTLTFIPSPGRDASSKSLGSTESVRPGTSVESGAAPHRPRASELQSRRTRAYRAPEDWGQPTGLMFKRLPTPPSQEGQEAQQTGDESKGAAS